MPETIAVEYIQEKEFDTLSTSNGVFVCDFTATWCGPCKMIAPMMEQLAQEHEGKIKVAKVDLGENSNLAKVEYKEHSYRNDLQRWKPYRNNCRNSSLRKI